MSGSWEVSEGKEGRKDCYSIEVINICFILLLYVMLPGVLVCVCVCLC